MCEVQLKHVDLHILLHLSPHYSTETRKRITQCIPRARDNKTKLRQTKKLVCCSLSAQRVEELEEALKKKDEDMKQMEERYKKYLEKAKSVSRLS